jgi:hypothetical protein
LQDVRKRAGLEIEDTIRTWITTDSELAEIVRAHEAYVRDETLSRDLHVAVVGEPGTVEPPAEAYAELVPASKMGGHQVALAVAKA